jgi:hypothetical protein
MRDLPALIVAVLLGGLILFGLLWLWFWFEKNGSSRYSSQDQSGYSSQDQNSYDSGYSRYGNSGYGRYGNNRYSGYDNGYNTDQPEYPYVQRVRRRARPCYNPCY